MPGVHPCVRAYLDRLPDGLASYPECVAKAALLRDILTSRPLDASVRGLDPRAQHGAVPQAALGRNVAAGVEDATPTSAEYWLRWGR